MPLHRAGNSPYPYVLTACPDGEGAWYSEAAQRNPELARQLKQDYKSKFTPEFAQAKAKQVQNLDLPLTIIDVGGRIDEKNRLIMSFATHAVILSGDPALISDWKQLCDELHLSVIAVIHSDYYAITDCITSQSPVLTGTVHHLERGEPNQNRPVVKALAALLAQLSQP